jgi:hypothetical protein
MPELGPAFVVLGRWYEAQAGSIFSGFMAQPVDGFF